MMGLRMGNSLFLFNEMYLLNYVCSYTALPPTIWTCPCCQCCNYVSVVSSLGICSFPVPIQVIVHVWQLNKYTIRAIGW